MRRSIRPVTLRRVIETCDLALKKGKLEVESLCDVLGTTKRHGKEIVDELKRMNLLEPEDNMYIPTSVAESLIKAYQKGDWKSIHAIFLGNYRFYKAFIDSILKDPLTKDEILHKLSDLEDMIFNKTALDMLCDWAERLSQVQRSLFTNRYYIIHDNTVQFNLFVDVLQNCYEALNCELRPGLKLVYVEVSRLREKVCEKLRIKRCLFDDLFGQVAGKFIGKMELCGAPLTTSAKKSPTSIRKMKRGGKNPVLSPTFTTIKEGKGVELDGKQYHYVAIFEPLRGV